MDPLTPTDPVEKIMRGLIYGHLAFRRYAAYRELSRIYADALEDRGDHRRADRRRRKADLLRSANNRWPRPADLGTSPAGHALTDHQAYQLGRATAEPVGVLCGTPGTGKTFTAGLLVRELVRRHGHRTRAVAVCAPTGKAAVRITEAIRAAGCPLSATTVHRLLECTRGGYDGEGWGFSRNAGRPLDQRYVLVEEASMLDVELAARLLEACAVGTHLLFIGDPYQLPPVGHGAPLRDVLASPTICRGELTEIKRNAGLIVIGCKAVRVGRPPATVPPAALSEQDNLAHVPARSEADQVEAVCDIYRRHLAAGGDHWQVQTVVPRNEDTLLSRANLNRVLQALLCDGAAIAGTRFRVGDKVICVKNGYYPRAADWDPDPDDPDGPQLDRNGDPYLANGEIGRAEGPSYDGKAIRFRFDDPTRLVEIANRKGGDVDVGLGNIDLAYAITAHKSQGSEWPVVIVPLDMGGGRVGCREWVYTAISRARQTCFLVGNMPTLARWLKTTALNKRRTRLPELLA